MERLTVQTHLLTLKRGSRLAERGEERRGVQRLCREAWKERSSLMLSLRGEGEEKRLSETWPHERRGLQYIQPIL